MDTILEVFFMISKGIALVITIPTAFYITNVIVMLIDSGLELRKREHGDDDTFVHNERVMCSVGLDIMSYLSIFIVIAIVIRSSLFTILDTIFKLFL